MILPDLVLSSRVNVRTKFCGSDSYDRCLDKKHFIGYPYDIDYVYNSRGFRDSEWPNSVNELQHCIWCVGDSFTVGIGQPYHHVWPQVLAQQTNMRTINISMDGASNDWIYRKARNIMDIIAPKHMVLMWSYTHRRESPDQVWSDEERRIHSSKDTVSQDTEHWLSMANQIKTLYPSVVQSSIPLFIPNFDYGHLQRIWNDVKDTSWPDCPKTLTDLENLPAHIRTELTDLHHCYENIEFVLNFNLPDHVIYIKHQLDYARDHHHFDILTSRWVVEHMIQCLNI